MMRKTGILCLLLGLAPLAEALPLWIRPDAKSGAFQVEQVQVRLSHFNTKWIGVEQKGGAVTGKATNSPDAFSFKGNWKVGNDSFTLEESIRRISGWVTTAGSTSTMCGVNSAGRSAPAPPDSPTAPIRSGNFMTREEFRFPRPG